MARDQNRGGGGNVRNHSVCPYCGEEFPLGGKCSSAEKHTPDAPVLFRKCRQCGGAAPIAEECLNCKQNRGKGQRPPQCPGCKNPLPASGDCSWCGRMWHCKTCDRWLKTAEHTVCPTCHTKMGQDEALRQAKEQREDKLALRDLKVGTTLVKCRECGLSFAHTVGGCPNCTVRCATHNLRHPKGQSCPKCAVPVQYELEAVADGDDRNRRWELSVQFVKHVGVKSPGIACRVRFLDPLRESEERDVSPDGCVFHAPYSVKPRRVKFMLIRSDDDVAGLHTKELELVKKPIVFHKTEVNPDENPWDAFRRSLKGE